MYVVTTQVQIFFNKQMNALTINASTLILSAPGQGQVSGTIAGDGNPVRPIPYGSYAQNSVCGCSDCRHRVVVTIRDVSNGAIRPDGDPNGPSPYWYGGDYGVCCCADYRHCFRAKVSYVDESIIGRDGQSGGVPRQNSVRP